MTITATHKQSPSLWIPCGLGMWPALLCSVQELPWGSRVSFWPWEWSLSCSSASGVCVRQNLPLQLPIQAACPGESECAPLGWGHSLLPSLSMYCLDLAVVFLGSKMGRAQEPVLQWSL